MGVVTTGTANDLDTGYNDAEDGVPGTPYNAAVNAGCEPDDTALGTCDAGKDGSRLDRSDATSVNELLPTLASNTLVRIADDAAAATAADSVPEGPFTVIVVIVSLPLTQGRLPRTDGDKSI